MTFELNIVVILMLDLKYDDCLKLKICGAFRCESGGFMY